MGDVRADVPLVQITIDVQLPGDPPPRIQYRSPALYPGDSLTLEEFCTKLGARTGVTIEELFTRLREKKPEEAT